MGALGSRLGVEIAANLALSMLTHCCNHEAEIYFLRAPELDEN